MVSQKKPSVLTTDSISVRETELEKATLKQPPGQQTVRHLNGKLGVKVTSQLEVSGLQIRARVTLGLTKALWGGGGEKRTRIDFLRWATSALPLRASLPQWRSSTPI